MSEALCRIEGIVGSRSDPGLAHRLHHIAHDGRVETIPVAMADLPRRRFRAVTDHGTECAIALPREAELFDGAVLLLEERRAIVVKVGEQRWLKLKPAEGFALELGYLAGNLHWRVRFEDGLLLVAVDVPVERYLARIEEHLADGRVTLADD